MSVRDLLKDHPFADAIWAVLRTGSDPSEKQAQELMDSLSSFENIEEVEKVVRSDPDYAGEFDVQMVVNHPYAEGDLSIAESGQYFVYRLNHWINGFNPAGFARHEKKHKKCPEYDEYIKRNRQRPKVNEARQQRAIARILKTLESMPQDEQKAILESFNPADRKAIEAESHRRRSGKA